MLFLKIFFNYEIDDLFLSTRSGALKQVALLFDSVVDSSVLDGLDHYEHV